MNERDRERGRGRGPGGRGWDRGDFEGPPWARGGRMRRGDIRTALLAALSDDPAHGYELIQRLEAKAGGRWRPSPGSVYPTLQLLEDEGLVRSVERDGKKVYEVTDEGRAQATTRIAEAGGTPWDLADRGGHHGELRESAMSLMAAARQVGMAGTAEQQERAVAILRDARKAIYAILAE